MKQRSYPLSKVYGLLEPGPVVMVTTARGGKRNVMTMAWHTMLDFVPPLVGCVISDLDYTFELLQAAKECVVAIPTVEIAEKVVRVGNTSGRDIDKFEAFGLTALPASRVKAPLVGECYANLECRVVDTSLVQKYEMFVLKVIKAWIDPSVKKPRTIHHRGRGVFAVDGETITFPGKMIPKLLGAG